MTLNGVMAVWFALFRRSRWHLCNITQKWCEVNFNILNRLGADHECDRQTDGRTDIAIANAVLHYVARPKCAMSNLSPILTMTSSLFKPELNSLNATMANIMPFDKLLARLYKLVV